MDDRGSTLEIGRSDPRPSLLGLGAAWTRVGYGVFALCALAFVLNFAVHPILPLPPGAKLPEGYHVVGGQGSGMMVRASALGAASAFLWIFSTLAAFVWTLVDVVDRRKRFVWLLPLFICPLVLALHALPLALYLFFGRETAGPEESVQ